MSTETPVRKSNAKISEALELLNEAARDKRDELKDLMDSRYSHLREAMTDGVDYGKEVYRHVKNFTQEAIGEGEKKAKEIAGDVDKRVRKDPWIYIAGAAVVSLLMGYCMGFKRK